MPLYTWKCADCLKDTVVSRPMSEYNKAPDECSNCASVNMSRIIVPLDSGVRGFVLNGDGWHHTEYSKYRSIK